MTWARLDDRANEHRKQLAAGAEACWLWACGLMYANRQLARDGFIPEPMLAMLYPFKNAKRLAVKLVDVGLWVKAAGGYHIHEFTYWNKSAEEREADLAGARERMRRVRSERAANKAVGSPEHEAKFAPGSGSTPTPLRLHSTPAPGADAPSPSPPVVSESEPEDRETVCPTDLLERAEKAGIPEQFAKAHGVNVEAVRGEIRETVAYWVLGPGSGKRRKNWLTVLRGRLHERAKEGRLGVAPPNARPNADWPTEDAARLREAIRSGQHGKALATKLEAGQLDYPLAQRLVRERQEAAVRRPDGQVGVPPPGDLSALLRGTTRAMP